MAKKSTETLVGVFVLLGIIALAFLALKAANLASFSAAKTYTVQMDYVFEPRVFAELQNAQAIVLAYDGSNPLPPTYCYLKPHYLDVQTSYFDHLAIGAL